jgi:Meckelin (Transmembrane protein 67)
MSRVCVQHVTPTFWQTWTRDISMREHTDSRRLIRATDSYKLWTRTIFYGQELRLVAFEVMLLGALDLWLQSTAAAACVTWIVTFVLGQVKLALARRCTARCTFVDECFLT